MAPVTNTVVSCNDDRMVSSPNDVPNDEDQEQFFDQYDAELSTLDGASFQSRLSPDKMSPEEISAFPDLVENTSLIPIFLHIRNSILKFWLIEPKVIFFNRSQI